jgi:hypothetical protein
MPKIAAQSAHTPLHLADVVPQVLHGQVLVTSRNANWEEHSALAELEVFDPAEAVTFLLARSGSSDEAAAAEIAEYWASCRWRRSRPAPTCGRPACRLPPTLTGCASSLP